MLCDWLEKSGKVREFCFGRPVGTLHWFMWLIHNVNLLSVFFICLHAKSLVGHVFTWLMVTTCWFLALGYNSIGKALTLQPLWTETHFRHNCVLTALIEDSSDGVEDPALHTGLHMSPLRTYLEECTIYKYWLVPKSTLKNYAPKLIEANSRYLFCHGKQHSTFCLTGLFNP